MLADLPPPPPPASISAEQAADLDCVRIGLTHIKLLGPVARKSVTPMMQAALARLKHSDPSRDWNAIATPLPGDMRYGDYMAKMETCRLRAAPAGRPPKP